MLASDFKRDDCLVGRRRISYEKLQREYRCNKCGSWLTIRFDNRQPDNWRIACATCDSADFIHERQLQQQEGDAIEILAGLPPELAALVK